jgi:2-methylcitrate dehydratase PrpD
MHYKPYPCCALFHGALDCFYNILEDNNLLPEEIESVRIYGRVGIDHPLYGNREIKTIADAQFNPRYIFSVAAHRVTVGAEWVDAATMTNPEILRFMDKVTFEEYRKPAGKGPANASRCDVTARGETFTSEKEFSRGTVGTPAAMTDDELIEKFRHNASRVLSKEKTERAIQAFLKLEEIENVSKLMKEVTLNKG